MLSQANSKYLLEKKRTPAKIGKTTLSFEFRNNVCFSNNLWTYMIIDKDSLLSNTIHATYTNVSMQYQLMLFEIMESK
jgi:hypothetical protein